MAIFINGAQAISPQNTFLSKSIPIELKEYSSLMKNILPNFKDYFNPLEMRRMSDIIKTSTTTAIECLKETNIDKIDAVITGTGQGCLEDTEKFLNKMLENNEEFLTPTSFIQSTHNTFGAHVALISKCNGHNINYVHKTISFESALLDAILLIKECKAKNILVGGVDETTQRHYENKKLISECKEEPFSNLDIYGSNASGVIPGEGTTFFLLSDEKQYNTYAELKMLDFTYKLKEGMELSQYIESRLKSSELSLNEIDLVLFGFNGDKDTDKYYHQIKDTLFINQDHAYYKHYCGEFDTASAFGLWIATRIIKESIVPDTLIIGERKKTAIKNVLLYNQDNNRNHTITVIAAC